MVAHSSLALDVIEAISMPNLKSTPSYLSEDDAVTVDMFMQSDYARDYMIDTSNIHWGGEVHQSHVFDIYATFSSTKDPVKVRLDMIQFVTSNLPRYNWDAHLYLKMHGLNLESWIQKMMFWENCADALAIYSLSDMLGIHTTVLMKSKPWTTISGDYQGDMYDLLHISKVALVYLGQDRYALLWKKSAPSGNSYVGPNFNYAPMANPSVVPTDDDLNTAQALLELHGDEPESEDQNQVVNPIIFTELLYDAMDKVVEHLDTCATGQLNVLDAMDSILESTQPNQTPVLHVEMATPIPEMNLIPALHVETKQYSVNLTCLELILADDPSKYYPLQPQTCQ